MNMNKDLRQAWSDYNTALSKQLQGWDRTGTILQMRESCWYNFPDPLDIRDDGYSNIWIYLLNGLYEFIMVGGTATSVFGFATALQYLERFRDFSPGDFSFGLFQVMLFLTFTWRFTRLYRADYQHFLRFRDWRWTTTQSILILSVILAPDWYWYSGVKAIGQNCGSNSLTRWFAKNASFINTILLSMRWGRMDAMTFRDIWFSSGRTNSSEPAPQWNKWENLKLSAAQALYRTVAENPSILLILGTAVAVAIYQIIKAIGIAVFVLTKEPMSCALRYYLTAEKHVIIYRDCFVGVLVERLLRIWRPLHPWYVGRFAATLWIFSIVWAKILLGASYALLRIVYYLYQAVGLYVLRYLFRGMFYFFRIPIPSTDGSEVQAPILPSSWVLKIIYLTGWITLECFCRFVIYVLRIPLATPRTTDKSAFPPVPPELSKISYIRLVEVEPSLFGFGPVVCSLKWYDARFISSYTAISYVWGSSTPDSFINVNGQQYLTTYSACQALTNLRPTWRRRRFWIDAICIDQSSAEDKSEQISHMAEIYRRADKVIVWLGPDDDARLAFALARRLLLGTRQQLTESGALRYVHHASKSAWSSLRRLMSNPWFERSWVMQEVLHTNVIIRYGDEMMPWTQFSMFAMAMSSEHDVCANLDETAQKLQADVQYGMTTRTSRQSISYIRVFQDFRALKLHQSAPEHLSLLFYLVRMFRVDCKFKTTETKDRIYSLVNMCGLANHPQFRSDFQPTESDTLTANALFVLVARHLLKSDPTERRLDLLSHAGVGNLDNTKSVSSLPSWVPDWSILDYPSLPLMGQDGIQELLYHPQFREQHHPQLKEVLRNAADLTMYDVSSGKHLHDKTPVLEKVLSSLDESVQRIKDNTMYRATGTTLPTFTLHPHPIQVLDVTGRYIDSIKVLGPIFPRLSNADDSNLSSREADMKETAVALNSWMALASPNLRERLVELARVLIGDLTHPSCDFLSLSTNLPARPAPKDKLLMLLDYLSVTFRLLKNESLESALLVQDTLSARYQSANSSKEIRLKDIMETDAHIRKVCAGRRFGMTKCGYMGLFPLGTRTAPDNKGTTLGAEKLEESDSLCESSDSVCLIYGTATPFVLRKSRHQSEDNAQNSSAFAGFTDEYQLVGPAYLQGFMDGEGLKNDFPETTFRLH